MDKENYSQHPLDRDTLEDQIPYLSDNLDGIYGLIVEEHCVGIELPQTVIDLARRLERAGVESFVARDLRARLN